MPPTLPRPIAEAIASTEAFTLPLSKVATRFGVHAASVARWITRGVTRGSRKVKLRGLRTGRNWHTNEQAVRDFLAECNAAERGEPSLASEAMDQKARELLAKHGIAY